MPSTRAPDGHVFDMRPEEVAVIMLQAMHTLEGHTFTRQYMRERYLEQGVTKEHVEALVHATCRVPGVTSTAYGHYKLPENFKRNVTHRTWRITPRRLNVADAEQLADLMEDQYTHLSPGLCTLLEQLRRATEELG